MTPTTGLPVVILISGAGSNMQRLADLSLSGELPIEIRAVISDRAQAKGLAIADSMGIATASLDSKQFTERAQFDAALAQLVSSYQPSLVILAGFMRILSGAFIQTFAGRLLNIHPSLLPKYRGMHTHQRALDAGDKEHGCSVHFVTEELDAGATIIQGRVPVLLGDTADTLAARVLQQEHRIYADAVKLFANGRLQHADGKAWLDGQELREPLQVSESVPSQQ